MLCPFRFGKSNIYPECITNRCAFWIKEDKTCAVAKIAKAVGNENNEKGVEEYEV